MTMVILYFLVFIYDFFKFDYLLSKRSKAASRASSTVSIASEIAVICVVRSAISVVLQVTELLTPEISAANVAMVLEDGDSAASELTKKQIKDSIDMSTERRRDCCQDSGLSLSLIG